MKTNSMTKMGILFLTWQRSLQKTLLPHKITLKQQFVLKKLTTVPFLSPSQIADLLFCDRPTASVIIKNMEREGWIRREKDNENGKQYQLWITEEGIKKYHSLEGASGPEDMARLNPLNCLSEEEMDQLDKLLLKALKGLKQS